MAEKPDTSVTVEVETWTDDLSSKKEMPLREITARIQESKNPKEESIRLHERADEVAEQDPKLAEELDGPGPRDQQAGREAAGDRLGYLGAPTVAKQICFKVKSWDSSID
ncbi:hypothetical protein GGS21DRAFT_528523 [Xylaria nigripes]|nr:hypothetical protein GGS21DRAFT_528523 [Xylaria nigripes]